MRRWFDWIVAALAVAPAAAVAQESPAAPPAAVPVAQQAEKAPPLTADQREELKRRLESKGREMEDLKGKASSVTRTLGDLAAQGKVPTTQEGIQALRDLVDQLEQIRQTLEKIQEEIEGIKAWMKAQNDAGPALARDIADLKRHRWGNYIQFQYRDTNQVGGATDAFSVRRARLGITEQVDPRTVLRASFDLATGTTATTAQLRDAFLRWDLEPSGRKVGTELSFGQMPLLLGYEIPRSSTEREFPERALYNRTMLAGERGRGVNVRHGLDSRNVVHLGVWNALTVDDPEQRTLAPGPENRLAVSGGWRATGSNWDFGISGFFGERPQTTTTRVVSGSTVTTVHPRLDREIVYVDGRYSGLLDPNVFVRFEYMTGKDRVPVTPGSQPGITAPRTRVNLGGHQLHVGYNLDPRNQVNVRWEQFDPDKDQGGDVVTTWAAAYSYFIHRNARVTAAQEWVKDPARAGSGQERYHITTLRVTFKF